MLQVLAAAAGATVSREDLAEGGGAGNERTVDVQVNRLRRKDRAGSRQPGLSSKPCEGSAIASSSIRDVSVTRFAERPTEEPASEAAAQPIAPLPSRSACSRRAGGAVRGA